MNDQTFAALYDEHLNGDPIPSTDSFNEDDLTPAQAIQLAIALSANTAKQKATCDGVVDTVLIRMGFSDPIVAGVLRGVPAEEFPTFFEGFVTAQAVVHFLADQMQGNPLVGIGVSTVDGYLDNIRTTLAWAHVYGEREKPTFEEATARLVEVGDQLFAGTDTSLEDKLEHIANTRSMIDRAREAREVVESADLDADAKAQFEARIAGLSAAVDRWQDLAGATQAQQVEAEQP